MSVFYPVLTQEFGWTRTTIAIAGSITLLSAGILITIVGVYLARYGSKPFLIFGITLLGATMLLYSRINAPWQMYVMHFLFAIALATAGVVTNILLVSNWFIRKRGMAIGAVITGTSLGAMIMAPLGTRLIKAYGWRSAMIIFGVGIIVLLLPLIIFVVRNYPREMNLEADGATTPTTLESSATQNLSGLTVNEALRTASFWSLAVGSALCFYVFFTINQQLVSHLQSPEIGLSKEAAAGVFSLMGGFSVAGKFFFGWLSDKVSKKQVNLVCCFLMFVGTLFLLNLSPATFTLFCAAFGLGFGGVYSTIQIMIGECFGTKALSKILALITFIETIGGFAGNIITGKLYDRTGNYQLAFQVIIACALVATICMALLKPSNLISSPARVEAEA